GEWGVGRRGGTARVVEEHAAVCSRIWPAGGRGSATAGLRVFDVAFQVLETLGPEPRPELLRRCPRIVGARDMSLVLALCAIHHNERRWLTDHPVLPPSSVAATETRPAASRRACSQRL